MHIPWCLNSTLLPEINQDAIDDVHDCVDVDVDDGDHDDKATAPVA